MLYNKGYIYFVLETTHQNMGLVSQIGNLLYQEVET